MKITHIRITTRDSNGASCLADLLEHCGEVTLGYVEDNIIVNLKSNLPNLVADDVMNACQGLIECTTSEIL